MSGVSAGAINSGGVAIFPKGKEQDAADLLVKLWSGVTAHSIWDKWGDKHL